MKYFALLGVLLVAVACGSKSDHGTFVDTANGGTSAGGRGNTAGAAGKKMTGESGEGGAADEDPLAPVVSITSPVQVTDPNVGPVVLEKVRVACTARKGSDPKATFAASSVSIEAFDASGKSIQKTVGTQNVDDASEFFSDFTLSASKISNGAISFKCTASDTSTPPISGSDVVNTFIDHGPDITPVTPAIPLASAFDYYPLGVVPFKFTVLPSPLSAKDKLAEVDEVTLTVNNVPIDISKAEDKANPGTYKVEINLADPILFKMVPNGSTSVSITATNKRKPLPVDHPAALKATEDYNFGIDGAGPKITIVSPSVVDAPVLGRQVKLLFTITDTQAGVDPTTISVKLNSQETHVFDANEWTHVDDTYGFTITDTNAVKGSTFQLSVGIEASDKAKNKALPATAQYWLDTTPPIVDLDPPPIIESNPAKVCSAPFDPVGSASPDDGEVIPSASIFRALVWDLTNTTDGAKVLHYSGVDPSTVRLYAQADPTQPLLIALHNATTCDEIATEGMPNVTKPPVPYSLSPIDAVGTAFYGSKDGQISPTIQNVCTAGTLTTPPDPLCIPKISDMTRVVQHDSGTSEDVIYTLTSGSSAECTGKVLDLSASVPNGWVCLAGRAVDRAGNVGVSAPIRVCLNNPNKPTPACANSSVPKPTCTSGCTVPIKFPPTVIQLN